MDSYETYTRKMDNKAIRLTNCIKRIIEIAPEVGVTHNGQQLETIYVIRGISSKSMDELHRILRLG